MRKYAPPPTRAPFRSAQLLIGRGLTESLAGRFELLHLPHWSYSEMRTAFGWSLEQFLYHGAYPGAAPLELLAGAGMTNYAYLLRQEELGEWAFERIWPA